MAFLFGALTLAAQTLLLRRFLWHFEAADLGVGIFLATWLAWTGAGAAMARTRAARPAVTWLSAHAWAVFPALALLAGVQYAALLRMRAWLGVPEYLTFPVLHLTLGCLLANAPFCLGAGLAFPALCQRVAARGRRMTGAFAAEALGAALAGVGVVALLTQGVPLDGGGTVAWQRAFRRGTPDGRFATPAGTYIHGLESGTFYVLGAGGIREMLPERDRSFEQAAMLLAQRPYAPQALALGRIPLATCLAIAELQPDCRVTWCPDDPIYAREVMARVRLSGLGGAADRVVVPGVSPRAFLATNQTAFSLVWAAPPSSASATGAGWWRPDFLARLRVALKPDGVAAFALGLDGLVRSGSAQLLLASQIDALTGVWPECGQLVAGAGGWWLACAKTGGLYQADDAAERFALLHVPSVPPAMLLELYSPTRVADIAHGTAIPTGIDAPLIRSTATDRTLAIRWLALAGRFRQEWPDASGCDQWMRQRLDRGAAACVPIMLLLGGLWMLPVAAGRRATGRLRATLAWLAATGFLGLAAMLGQMQILELRFGSLYLLAGLASACYLTGLFAGNRLGAAMRCGNRRLAPAAILAAQLALTWLAWRMTLRTETALTVVAACGLCGLPAGAAMAVAGSRLEGTAGAQGAGLLLADAWGSAVGGLLFAAFLLPCLGGATALLLVALLAIGVTAITLVAPEQARFAAAVACSTCLLTGGLAWQADWNVGTRASAEESRMPVGPDETNQLPSVLSAPATNIAADADAAIDAPAGISRPVDPARLQRLWSTRELSKHPADFWTPEPATGQGNETP
jgi:hypothetical protein